jgi:hypothetical protein
MSPAQREAGAPIRHPGPYQLFPIFNASLSATRKIAIPVRVLNRGRFLTTPRRSSRGQPYTPL